MCAWPYERLVLSTADKGVGGVDKAPCLFGLIWLVGAMPPCLSSALLQPLFTCD